MDEHALWIGNLHRVPECDYEEKNRSRSATHNRRKPRLKWAMTVGKFKGDQQIKYKG